MNTLIRYKKEILVTVSILIALTIFFGILTGEVKHTSSSESLMLPDQHPEIGRLERLMENRGLTREEMEKLVMLQEEQKTIVVERVTIREFLEDVPNNREEHLRSVLRSRNYSEKIINSHIDAVKNNDPKLLKDLRGHSNK